MWSVQWEIGPDDFLSETEIRRLRTFVFRRAIQCKKWNKTRVLEYMVIETGLQTGLRVKELSDLRCGDVALNGSMSYIRVQHGKGGRQGIVRLGNDIVERLRWYLDWKRQKEESTEPESPLFVSSHTGGVIKKRAIQNMFARCCQRARIQRPVHTHMMRHTYASMLYAKSGHNLRLVQIQLRHKSSRTTEVYANVLSEAYEALDKLYE